MTKADMRDVIDRQYKTLSRHATSVVLLERALEAVCGGYTKQVQEARLEMAGWTKERIESVRLQGGSPSQPHTREEE